MRTLHASAILCLALALGCGKPPAPPIAVEKLWPTTSAVVIPPEITVTEIRFKSGGELGFQHRGFYGEWNGPLDHVRIQSTLKDLYDAYAREIEEVDPTASVKRIAMTLRVRHVWQPIAHLITSPDDTIEPWPPETFEYVEFDEATRPTAADLKMLEDYGKVETRESDGETGAIARWLQETGFTLEQLERAWTHRNVWIEGKVATKDLIDKRMKEQGTIFKLPGTE
jgi:hypothetical protein